jgi:hypothetical protein
LPGIYRSQFHERLKKEPPEANSLRADIGFLLEKLDVFRLEALRPLDHVKRHRLAFLKAAESIRLDGGEMHENIFAGLPVDKAETLSAVKTTLLFLVPICYLAWYYSDWRGPRRRKWRSPGVRGENGTPRKSIGN